MSSLWTSRTGPNFQTSAPWLVDAHSRHFLAFSGPPPAADVPYPIHSSEGYVHLPVGELGVREIGEGGPPWLGFRCLQSAPHIASAFRWRSLVQSQAAGDEITPILTDHGKIMPHPLISPSLARTARLFVRFADRARGSEASPASPVSQPSPIDLPSKRLRRPVKRLEDASPDLPDRRGRRAKPSPLSGAPRAVYCLTISHVFRIVIST